MLVMDPIIGDSPLPTLASAQRSPEVGAVVSFKPFGCPAEAAAGNKPNVVAMVAAVAMADRRDILSTLSDSWAPKCQSMEPILPAAAVACGRCTFVGKGSNAWARTANQTSAIVNIKNAVIMAQMEERFDVVDADLMLYWFSVMGKVSCSDSDIFLGDGCLRKKKN